MRRPPHRLAIAMLIAFLAVSLTTKIHAERVDRLVRILRSSKSYKVRLQAAVSLGRIGNARAVPALVRALRDRQFTVRAVAAAALGEIGDPSALPALKKRVRREKKRFVRKQIRKAIRVLRRANRSVASRGVYLKVGKIRNESTAGDETLADVLAGALHRVFKATGKLTMTPFGRPLSPRELRRKRISGYTLDGAITRLSQQREGADTTLTCKIRVVLSTYPQNSMKAFYNGGASVSVRTRNLTPRVRRQLYKDLLDGAAEGARQNIMRSYLSKQTGGD